MISRKEPKPSAGRVLKAVCFDFRGVVLDHRTNKSFVPGIESLLRTLQTRHIALALVSRFPAEILLGLLGPMGRFFGKHLYSGGGRGKLDGIKEFAQEAGIDNLAQIAFVDDKPENILPVSQGSKVYVIGFRGSGKYPEARDACRDRAVPYAENVGELRGLLLDAMAK